MRVAVIFLVAGIILLSLFLYPALVRSDSTTVDFHFHDTYLVIQMLHFVIVIGLFALTLFGLGGVIGTGFRSKAFLLTFLIAILLDGLVAWSIYNQL